MKKSTSLLVFLGIWIQGNAQVIKPHCYNGLVYLSGNYSCASYDDWVLVFEDDFTENNLNYERWRNDFPWGRNLYCAGYPEYFSDGDNFEFDNGILKLIADEETVYERIMDDWADDSDMMCGDEYNGENKRWFEYTSGMIFSNQAFQYGKFEIRCRIPTIEKLWPAFWLYGTCAQEIDVFEFMSESTNPTLASKEITYTYHRKLSCEDEDKVVCADKQNTGVDMSLAMHTYSVEWDEQKIIWRLDGAEVLRKYKWFTILGQEMLLCGQIPPAYYSMDTMYPFDNVPMNIIASLGVRDDSNASFPVEMQIDWIRVYQRINTSSSVNICVKNDIKGSTVAGQEISIGGSGCSLITIEEGEYLTLAAKNRITLNSSFKVEDGAVFLMMIDN